jgi:hypothetical protein
MRKIQISILVLGLFTFVSTQTFAATRASRSSSSMDVRESSSSRSVQQQILVDVSGLFVRDTKEGGKAGPAGKLSIGGMFTDWIGVDFTGLYESNSKSYLLGSDIRLMPTDWFFLKGGIGGYSEKKNGALRMTPLAGTGIMARMSSDLYFLTEASYFQVQERSNLGVGVGFGVAF